METITVFVDLSYNLVYITLFNFTISDFILLTIKNFKLLYILLSTFSNSSFLNFSTLIIITKDYVIGGS